MTTDEFEELKWLIATKMGPMELLDFLGFSMFDLVETLREQIENQQQEFERELR